MAFVSLRQVLDHAAYKFTRKPTGDILAIDRIAAIHTLIPNTYLVMHDSSSVPVEEIQRAIQSGVRKINIDTDIRLAMTGAMRQVFALQPSEFDPRKALVAAKNAARGIVKARFEAFG